MNKLETLQRLQEIKLQLIQIKKERDFLTTIENALKTESETLFLEMWESIPGLDNKEGGLNNGSINSQTTRSL